MAEHRVDSTQHATGQHALWQELCEAYREIDRLQAIATEAGFGPDVATQVDRLRQLLRKGVDVVELLRRRAASDVLRAVAETWAGWAREELGR